VDSWTECAIDAIAKNAIAGAAELADQGADVLLRCARVDETATLADFNEQVLQISIALIRAQPAMAPLVNLANTALWELDACRTHADARTRLATLARDFKRRLRMHETAIAEAVLPLIPDQAVVLTHSRSATVRAALLLAQRAGRQLTVVCAEGRPNYEGRVMATELAAQNIPVRLVIDALAASRATQADLVLVGTDHLNHDGLANKAGTFGIAMAAKAVGVPVYALCSSSKFLPPGYARPKQHHRPPEQVWDQAPASVQVENFYFDYTPLNSIAGIVTERGALPPAVIEGWLAALQLHPALAASQVG
jgi:translation initiation factor eIF-2B subunit delta